MFLLRASPLSNSSADGCLMFWKCLKSSLQRASKLCMRKASADASQGIVATRKSQACKPEARPSAVNHRILRRNSIHYCSLCAVTAAVWIKHLASKKYQGYQQHLAKARKIRFWFWFSRHNNVEVFIKQKIYEKVSAFVTHAFCHDLPKNLTLRWCSSRHNKLFKK